MSGQPPPPATPLVPKTTAQLESNTATERANRDNKGEPKTGPIGLPFTSQMDPRTGQRLSEEYGGDLDTVLITTDTRRPGQPPGLETCCTYSPHLALRANVPAPLQMTELAPTIKPQLTTNQESVETPLINYHKSTHELQTDIYLRSPTGEHVPRQEALWELNPYAMACGDTSGLMGITPGHYHLWANATAATLCTLRQSNLRSQFYRTPPIRESSSTLPPIWSLGKEKVINNQKRSASRRQALEAGEYARNVVTRSTVTTSSSTLSQNQERPRTNDDIHQEASAQEPIYEEIAVPLKDNGLFYKNGNPKPLSTGRLPRRGLTSRERKRPGGRKKDRRRDRRHGSPVEAPKEFNPEIPEKTNEGDDPTQPLNPARDRMLLFPFIKYAVGIQNREIHTGPIHSSELPAQHIATLPEEPGTEIGAACFEPHTALLLQDPLNHDTYDPGETLSRPIRSLRYEDTVLAEKQGPDGRSKFFLAKVVCVMLFEIAQDRDSEANKILQDKTLSTGLGFTLTKHHHIRKHSWIHKQEPGRWLLTNQAINPEMHGSCRPRSISIPLPHPPQNTRNKSVQPRTGPSGQCGHPHAQERALHL